MRLNLSHEKTIRGGRAPIESNVHKTSINNTIFRIVTKGLYIRPIEAIVREICTNALDGHIAAGKADAPFDVTLPSTMSPYFIVRDYGISMDNETVFNVYAVLGESTKNETSNSIGGWGVGGKSPAAYTDTFFITTYKDGVRRIYQSSCLQNSSPLELLLEGATEEKDGVEVKIPVKTEDFQRFINAAETQLSPFDVKPNIISDVFVEDKFNYDFNLEKAETLTINPNIYVPDDTGELVRSNNDTTVYLECTKHILAVRMGCVVYPINVTSEYFEQYEKKLDAIKLISGKSRFLIDLPVDTVDIKPSREDLDYTERTNIVLTILMNSLYKYYFKQVISIAYKARNLPTNQAIKYIFDNSISMDMTKYIMQNYKTKPDFSDERMLYVEVPFAFRDLVREKLREFTSERGTSFDFSVCDGEKTKRMSSSDARFWYTISRSITLIKRDKGYIKKLNYWSNEGDLPESGLVSKYLVNHASYSMHTKARNFLKSNYLKNGDYDSYIVVNDDQLTEVQPLLEQLFQHVEVVELEDLPKQAKERNRQSNQANSNRYITIRGYLADGNYTDLNRNGRYAISAIKDICEDIKSKYDEEIVFTLRERGFDHNYLKELCQYHGINVIMFDLPDGVTQKLLVSKNVNFHPFEYVLKTMKDSLPKSFLAELKAQMLEQHSYKYFKEYICYRDSFKNLIANSLIKSHFFKFVPDAPSEVEYTTIATGLVTNKEHKYLDEEAKRLYKRTKKRFEKLCQYRPTLSLIDNYSEDEVVIELLKLNFKGFNPDAN